ncbi:hypothetical protein FA13DRAFT_1739119 [Coprinellus micaceus]|uniref:Uncharacterized protein n=1 Tax=Coprinellus micaceus TaxID=71717 RepID=A0A4Y7STG7_COPMI|nr:hypothetical protein FA13DRAFT_1739119 [Coprinellus micaceus]
MFLETASGSTVDTGKLEQKTVFQGALERGRKRSVAHREGRTRSLQMPPSGKSLTLYPIELGGPISCASGAPL